MLLNNTLTWHDPVDLVNHWIQDKVRIHNLDLYGRP